MKKKKRFKNIMIVLTVAIAALIGMKVVAWMGAEPAQAEAEITRCGYHGIDISLCSRCNPELIPDFKARGDWCASHNLPESQCDLCDYGRVHEDEHDHDHEGHDHAGHDNESNDNESDAHEGHDHSAGESHDDEREILPEAIHDYEHQLVEFDIKPADGQYKPEFLVFFPENAIECTTDGAVIQLASVKTAERTGMTVRPAVAIESSHLIEAPAEVVLDETRTAVLSTTIPALVTQWLIEPGQTVAEGELLARLSSPELPEMKAEYLEAHASWMLAKNRLDRQKELYDRELISDSEYEDMETEFAIADAHLTGQAGVLKSAGLSEVDLDAVIEDKIITPTLNIYAPSEGVIIERIAVLGKLLDEGNPLAVIGDPGSLWIEAQVREEEASYFAVGDEVIFSSDGIGLKRCSGEIIWVAQFLDTKTRSLTVRARIKEASDILHSGEFGRIILNSREKAETVAVPKDAVQWEGCCNVVFVRESIDRFRPRKVRIEPGESGYYRVLDGLSAGEEIVVEGSYLMKTELRKSSIGAGCCGL